VVRAHESATGGGGQSLATARVVVGGGRGVGSAEGFAPLEELAALLGGVVWVSRVVTSEGWRPHTMQVGQTGTKITPDLYLACGISGAIQHFAGCSGAKHIIAINTDPAAPMMTRADYAVVGDLHDVVPALIEALRSRGA
jgi:electron transfer flavoprotein alpha subunit